MMPLNQMHIFQKNVEVDDMALMLKPLCFFSLSTLMIKREEAFSTFHPLYLFYLSCPLCQGKCLYENRQVVIRYIWRGYFPIFIFYQVVVQMWWPAAAEDLSKYNRVIFTHEENSDRRPQRILNKIGSKCSKFQSLTFRVSICNRHF